MSVRPSDPDWLFRDFNSPRLAFRPLGKIIGQSVEDAWAVLDHDPDSPKAWEAGVRAARMALPKLAELARCGGEAATAFVTICDALEHVERSIRNPGYLATLSRKKRGTKVSKDIKFQGRAFLAVKWLQNLKSGRLGADEAFEMVARQIPEHLLEPTRRGGKKRPAHAVLTGWVDAFARTTGREAATRVPILNDLKFQIWETWSRTSREPIIDHRGKPKRDADDMIVYGEEQIRDSSDASPADVIAWLRGVSAPVR